MWVASLLSPLMLKVAVWAKILHIENGNIEGCVRRRGDTIGIGEFRNEE